MLFQWPVCYQYPWHSLQMYIYLAGFSFLAEVISHCSIYGCSRGVQEPANTSAATQILKPENVKIATHTHTHTLLL